MKRVVWLMAVVWWLGLGSELGAQPRIVNGFAAIVNDRLITYEDVDAEIRPADIEAAQMRFGRQPEALTRELGRLRQDALRALIERELILTEFNSAGYQLPESLVDEQLKDRIRQDYGDRARLIQTLQAQGTTLDRFRQRIRERFILDAMTAKFVSSGVLISPYKIEKYYQENLEQFQLKDRVKLRMISLWNRPDRGPVATRKLADDFAEQLKAGASFSELASLYSDDPNRRQGGDRGWVELDGKDLRSDLQAFAFLLEAGEPSEVLEKEEGCYLMLVEEREQAHTRQLSQVRDEVEGILQQRERARLREAWITRLRQKSFVRYFPLN